MSAVGGAVWSRGETDIKNGLFYILRLTLCRDCLEKQA